MLKRQIFLLPLFAIKHWRNPSQNALWTNLAAFCGGWGKVRMGGNNKTFHPHLHPPPSRGRKQCVIKSAVIASSLLLIILLIPSNSFAASIYQDTNRFTYGAKRILTAPFQIPVRTLQGTLSGPLIVGTVGGILQGTFHTVGDLIGGVFDMAAAAAPYAKYAVLF